MKALLDTNIIIHREANKIVSQDIGILYRWLDRGKYTKCIHSATIEEIKKNPNKETVKLFLVKLDSYETIEIPSPIQDEVKKISESYDRTENDLIDTSLLNEVFVGRVDILITEDKKIHKKANALGIQDKVYTIDSFLERTFAEHPDLVNYKVLKRPSQNEVRRLFCVCKKKIGQAQTSLSQDLPVSLIFCILGNQAIYPKDNV